MQTQVRIGASRSRCGADVDHAAKTFLTVLKTQTCDEQRAKRDSLNRVREVTRRGSVRREKERKEGSQTVARIEGTLERQRSRYIGASVRGRKGGT